MVTMVLRWAAGLVAENGRVAGVLRYRRWMRRRYRRLQVAHSLVILIQLNSLAFSLIILVQLSSLTFSLIILVQLNSLTFSLIIFAQLSSLTHTYNAASARRHRLWLARAERLH